MSRARRVTDESFGMTSPLENLKQQYAAEVVKVDADEEFLKRLERGTRVLQGVAEPAGQCRA